jgi:hypothetical protein
MARWKLELRTIDSALECANGVSANRLSSAVRFLSKRVSNCEENVQYVLFLPNNWKSQCQRLFPHLPELVAASALHSSEPHFNDSTPTPTPCSPVKSPEEPSWQLHASPSLPLAAMRRLPNPPAAPHLLSKSSASMAPMPQLSWVPLSSERPKECVRRLIGS